MRQTFLLCVLALGCGGRTDLDETVTDGGLLEDVVVGDAPISDSGPQPDAIPIQDVTVPPMDVSVPPVDAGMPGDPITCGTTTCDSATQVCCITFAGMMASETCTAPTACMGVSLACSSALDCPMGEVCCANITMMTQDSQCQAKCMGGFQNPQLCASSSECPMGQTCQNTPFGYKICRF
jgi:hypothetical protein